MTRALLVRSIAAMLFLAGYADAQGPHGSGGNPHPSKVIGYVSISKGHGAYGIADAAHPFPVIGTLRLVFKSVSGQEHAVELPGYDPVVVGVGPGDSQTFADSRFPLVKPNQELSGVTGADMTVKAIRYEVILVRSYQEVEERQLDTLPMAPLTDTPTSIRIDATTGANTNGYRPPPIVSYSSQIYHLDRVEAELAIPPSTNGSDWLPHQAVQRANYSDLPDDL